MNKVRSFEEVYEEIKTKNESKMKEVYDEAKRETKKANKIALIVCSIVDILIIVIAIASFNVTSTATNIKIGMYSIFPDLMKIIIADIIICVIVKAIFAKNGLKYNNEFKELLIRDLLKNFFNTLDYTPYIGIDRGIYEEGGYREYYDKYYSDDHINAKLNDKNNINMAEVTTIREETDTDSEGHTTTRDVTVFSGLFAKIELDKSIKTNIKIQRRCIIYAQ